MRYRITPAGWTTILAAFIDQTQDGDVIVVPSEEMKALAERARRRMCPEKAITFEVEALFPSNSPH